MLDRRSIIPPDDLDVEIEITGQSRDGETRFGVVTAAAVARAHARVAERAAEAAEASARELSVRAEWRARDLRLLAQAVAEASPMCRCGTQHCWREGSPETLRFSRDSYVSRVPESEAHYRVAGKWLVGVARGYVWGGKDFDPPYIGTTFVQAEACRLESDAPDNVREFYALAAAAQALAAAPAIAALTTAKVQYPDWVSWTGWPSESRMSPSEFAIAAYRAGHGRRTTNWYHVRTTESGGHGEYTAATLGAMVALPVEGHSDLIGECWLGWDANHRTD